MLASSENYYLTGFLYDYDLPEEVILKVMHECEEDQDPEDFDYDYWEGCVREYLRQLV